MPKQDKKPWFPVKRFGYGVGFPIAWQGWLVLALYAATLLVAGSLLSTPAFVISAFPLTAAVIYISYVRSDGEWRYRNGE